jgi:aminoglycoside phosphotransferase (APT) family kinase protein
MTDVDDQRARLEAYLNERVASPGTLKVTQYEPIIGGYSRAMARVWVEDAEGRRGYITRADPPPHTAIIDTDRAAEWQVLTALAAAGTIPMPAPLWFDESGAQLGTPTIVMEMVDGEALIAKARASDASEHPAMAMGMCEVAATIHAYDIGLLPDHLPVPTSWDEYIDGRIQEWIDAEREHVDADPFMRLVASWLRANKPPPAPLGLVHGDFQIANLLIDNEGTYLAVDWELAHVGDPREDLGWMAFAAVTQPPDLIADCTEEFHQRYRELSGLGDDVVNPATIAYFTVLASGGVFIPVIREMAAVAKGEAAGMTVIYMSNAVAGMHMVLMNAMAEHDRLTGGAK